MVAASLDGSLRGFWGMVSWRDLGALRHSAECPLPLWPLGCGVYSDALSDALYSVGLLGTRISYVDGLG